MKLTCLTKPHLSQLRLMLLDHFLAQMCLPGPPFEHDRLPHCWKIIKVYIMTVERGVSLLPLISYRLSLSGVSAYKSKGAYVCSLWSHTTYHCQGSPTMRQKGHVLAPFDLIPHIIVRGLQLWGERGMYLLPLTSYHISLSGVSNYEAKGACTCSLGSYTTYYCQGSPNMRQRGHVPAPFDLIPPIIVRGLQLWDKRACIYTAHFCQESPTIILEGRARNPCDPIPFIFVRGLKLSF